MAAFRVYDKRGNWYDLSAEGDILYDGSRSMRFAGDGKWRILGFGKRAHSATLVSLEAAAQGADIGQGWVHDLDHGTHRMWGSPSYRRVARVIALNA